MAVICAGVDFVPGFLFYFSIPLLVTCVNAKEISDVRNLYRWQAMGAQEVLTSRDVEV